MSDRNVNGGFEHRRGNGGYRGGYGGRGGYRSGGYVKINQDDVPESRHSLFIRGLPSNIKIEEILDFFEDNIGRCSLEYQKVNNYERQLYVAIRFESKDDAKKAYKKYRHEDILGCRCDVTWFRDIRRYIEYQKQRGGFSQRGSFGGGRGFHNNHQNQDSRKRRYSEVENRRSRSRSESDSDRSRSRSRSPSSDSDRSRSRSRSVRSSSSSSRESERRSRSKEEKRRGNTEIKTNNSKKARTTESKNEVDKCKWERSRSNSPSDRNETPPKKRKDKEVRPSSPSRMQMSPPPPFTPVIMEAVVSSSTTSTSAPESPVKHISQISSPLPYVHESQRSNPISTLIRTTTEEGASTIVNKVEMAKASATSSNDSLVMEKPNPPFPLPPTQTPVSHVSTFSVSQPSIEGRTKIGEILTARCPNMAKTIREMKEFQHQLISTVKPDSLHLSSSLTEKSPLKKMEEREKQINELDRMQKFKFESRMKQLVKTFQGDAKTITTVINSTVQKDPSLEEKIKPALLSILEDLEQKVYKNMDDFLVCGV